MGSKRPDLLQGTLDFVVLKMLSAGALHGYAIAQKILLASRQTLEVQQGSLYPALHRLERKGLITSEWKETESGRMAKFYSLTTSGKAHLVKELEEWTQYVNAISWVLEA